MSNLKSLTSLKISFLTDSVTNLEGILEKNLKIYQNRKAISIRKEGFDQIRIVESIISDSAKFGQDTMSSIHIYSNIFYLINFLFLRTLQICTLPGCTEMKKIKIKIKFPL